MTEQVEECECKAEAEAREYKYKCIITAFILAGCLIAGMYTKDSNFLWGIMALIFIW